MTEIPVTGMTERAICCMYPESRGGCDQNSDLVPIHYKFHHPDTGVLISDQILGWLCKPHALELATVNADHPLEL